MFNDISSKYDFLNHLLSFGLHIRWRKALARFLPPRPGLRVLDLATGTADVLLALVQNSPNVQSGCGIDLAEKMMEIGRAKIAKRGFANRISLHKGDVNQIPFNPETFDVVTIAFGIRNVEEPEKILTEIRRVLLPGGRALILEFSLPRNRFIRRLHLFYLRQAVPFIGGLFTRQQRAYRYLNKTIEAFPYGAAFCGLMIQAGFANVRAHPLLFGTAMIYTGDKIKT